jgi:hypothetical protein
MAKQSGATYQELPPKPRVPDMSECCQRNCEHCVFVYYEKALDRWRKKVEKLKAQIPNNSDSS